ncbi:diguanylate cyclase domain-containing protein [Mycobacterium servetii]|uniref:diguanylate cyclase domain-containing protein n=1 Tax=Mycobacterium servetii TaxID=3237418 RepID=UPI0035103022
MVNRAGWEIATADLLARSRSTAYTVTVIAVDIDNFKQINDTDGHLRRRAPDPLRGALARSGAPHCGPGQAQRRRVRLLHRRPCGTGAGRGGAVRRRGPPARSGHERRHRIAQWRDRRHRRAACRRPLGHQAHKASRHAYGCGARRSRTHGVAVACRR